MISWVSVVSVKKISVVIKINRLFLLMVCTASSHSVMFRRYFFVSVVTHFVCGK